MLKEFTERLKVQLMNDLPGFDAHKIMSPANRINHKEYIKEAEKNAKKSAVLITLFQEENLIKSVIIKRTDYKGIHSGQISFPGGKYEESDLTFENTAKRETLEEIGIEPDKIEIIGSLSNIYIPPSNFLVTPFIGFINEIPSFKPDPKEVDQIISFKLDILLSERIIGVKKFTTSSAGWKIDAPYFSIEGNEVWGATAMILSELKQIIRNTGYFNE